MHRASGSWRTSGRRKDSGIVTTTRAPSRSRASRVAAPASGPAVTALLRTADAARRDGRLTVAAANLERAQRIEPRNPRVWHHLARLRLDQGKPTLAEELALKSNSLSGHDWVLVRQNWRLVARARQRRGVSAGARRARRAAEPR